MSAVLICAVEREDAPGVWVRIPGTVSGTPEQLGQLLEWLECSVNKRARLVEIEATAAVPLAWQPGEFESRRVDGLVTHKGYVRGAFGVARSGPSDWCIYHLPTGMTFNYSYWRRASEAMRFADELLRVQSWDWLVDEDPAMFHGACHLVADRIGVEHRHMIPVDAVIPPPQSPRPLRYLC